MDNGFKFDLSALNEVLVAIDKSVLIKTRDGLLAEGKDASIIEAAIKEKERIEELENNS